MPRYLIICNAKTELIIKDRDEFSKRFHHKCKVIVILECLPTAG